MSDDVAEAPPEVQCLLIPQQQVPLLLPMDTVIEIIGYREPTKGNDSSKEWLLGFFPWRQLSLPLISMKHLLGAKPETRQRRGRVRIVVVHVFCDDLQHPFVGIMTTGIPRLVKANEESLRMTGTESWPEDWPVISMVKMQWNDAIIPDLDCLGRLVQELSDSSHE